MKGEAMMAFLMAFFFNFLNFLKAFSWTTSKAGTTGDEGRSFDGLLDAQLFQLLKLLEGF